MLKLKTRNSDIDVLLNVRDIKKFKAPTSYLGIGIFKVKFQLFQELCPPWSQGGKV